MLRLDAGVTLMTTFLFLFSKVAFSLEANCPSLENIEKERVALTQFVLDKFSGATEEEKLFSVADKSWLDYRNNLEKLYRATNERCLCDELMEVTVRRIDQIAEWVDKKPSDCLIGYE